MQNGPSERSIVLVVGAVQFVNILDFMMVMPLGPDFAAKLGIPLDFLGYVAGSYTAAAAVSGLAGSFFLDRFDRRAALMVAMLGLALGTALGAGATGFRTLLAARVIAGLFGGPATSIAYAIIADVIPEARRGRAMGAVMGAFAAASVLGVPVGLELSRMLGWRAPFLAVGAAGLVIAFAGRALLPALRVHLDGPPSRRAGTGGLGELVRGRGVLESYAMTALMMGSTFVLVPNISAYVQANLHYPRERLGLLYMIGGVVSFATTRLAGYLVDRLGVPRVAVAGCVAVALVTYAGFAVAPPLIPVMAIFTGFMAAASLRAVSYNTLASKVPSPKVRAQFMSIQSAVQHVASAAGAFVAAQLLRELPDKTLVGMSRTAWSCIGLNLVLPTLFFVVDARVRVRPEGATMKR